MGGGEYGCKDEFFKVPGSRAWNSPISIPCIRLGSPEQVNRSGRVGRMVRTAGTGEQRTDPGVRNI